MTDIDAILGERRSAYGDFECVSETAQLFKDILRKHGASSSLSFSQKQALEAILDKIARIINGNPNYEDNWIDIQGYAKLISDSLREVI